MLRDSAAATAAEELIFVEGLHQEIGGTGLHAEHAALDIGEAGHEDDRKGPSRIVHGTLDIEPAESGHPDVQYQAAGNAGIGSAQKLRRRRIALDGVAADPKQPLEATADGILVVHDEYDRLRVLHGASLHRMRAKVG